MEILIIKSVSNNTINFLLLDMPTFTLVATHTSHHYLSIPFMLLMDEHAIRNDPHRSFYVGQIFSLREGPYRIKKGNLPS